MMARHQPSQTTTQDPRDQIIIHKGQKQVTSENKEVVFFIQNETTTRIQGKIITSNQI
jgi:hypothetical protein